MITSIRITFMILLVASSAMANAKYEQVNTTDFVTRADAYQGRLVAVTGEIRVVNADGKSLRLFDTGSRVLIDVELSQLNKAQRNALIRNPVRYVSVYGKADLRNGRLFIDAHKVVAGR